MDQTKMEKLEAMAMYRRKRSFLDAVVKCLVSFLSLGLILSSMIWIPEAFSCARYFKVVILGPRFSFVVCNVIILFLVSEKRGRYGGVDVYDEYAEHSRRMRDASRVENDVEVEEVEKCTIVCSAGACIEGEEEEEDDAEDGDLMVEELNEKVESFIARIKEQRRMEATMML